MVIKCPVCDEENPDDAEECKACGSPLKENLPPEKKDVKSGKILLAIFVAIIVIIVAIVAAPFVYKNVSTHPTRDRDGDSIPDDKDAFPDDPTEWADNDNDGIGDNADPDDDNDGILDTFDVVPTHDAGVIVEIERLRIKDPVDGTKLFPKDTGQIFFMIYIDDIQIAQLPVEGPEELQVDKDYKINWESPPYNVPDDEAYHTIRIEMYDDDGLFGDELLDINEIDSSKLNSGKYLEINYYMGNEVGWEQTGVSDGSNDGNVLEKDGRIEYRITTVDVFA
ncbi:MAG: zinc ribbon domain-containing protein [Thermoplasmata archaeon]|nr:MAG: zinc ribbon domain-containing protein [Thermoplasmata archaeon]